MPHTYADLLALADAAETVLPPGAGSGFAVTPAGQAEDSSPRSPEEEQAILDAGERCLFPHDAGEPISNEAVEGDAEYATAMAEREAKAQASNRDTDDKAPPAVPARLNTIVTRLSERFACFPRRVGADLFTIRNGKIEFHHKPPALMAWFARSGPVVWHNGKGFVPQSQLFEAWQQLTKVHESVQAVPHEPLLPGHYYLNKPPEVGDGRTLERLLDFFHPETLVDRLLMKAAVATPMWGGPPGKRPVHLVQSMGRGMGKTRFCQVIGDLYGGIIDISPDEDITKVKGRFLTPDAIPLRVATLDNVKVARFSFGPWEALVTCEEISGWRPYYGNSNRKNLISWFVTINGASLSRDIAQRVVEIRLGDPTYSAQWELDLAEFLESYRDELLGDIIGFLRLPPRSVTAYTRWALWEAEVLARTDHPDECIKLIQQRRQALDVEVEEGEIIEEFFATRLAGLGYNPDRDDVFIPNQIATRWYCEALGERRSVTAVSRALRQAKEERQVTRIIPCRFLEGGRGSRWEGVHCDSMAETHHDILQRIAKKLSNEERDREKTKSEGRIEAETSVQGRF